MPSQNRRNNSYNRQRQPQRRRGGNSRKKSIFSSVGFWIFVCAVIIIIVLAVKGCDTGKIEADAVPSAESLAPSVNTSADETQKPDSQNSASPIPVTGDNPNPTVNNSNGTAQGNTGSQTHNTPNTVTVKTPKDNYYKEYDLGAGNYVIGTDLPAGTVDFTAISGTGSISTSNGTLSIPTFGTEDGYTGTVENMVLYSGTKMTVTGSLRMRVSYVSQPEEISETSSQSGSEKELAAGTYTSGKDFTAGTYDFSIVSGYGTVTSSNASSGDGIDEMMGLADEGGNYSQSVKGISLPDGTTLTVEGCTVKITKRN